jgi:hypothetical protein
LFVVRQAQCLANLLQRIGAFAPTTSRILCAGKFYNGIDSSKGRFSLNGKISPARKKFFVKLDGA